MRAQYHLTAAALVLISTLGSACASDPPVSCQSVPQDHCDRAVAMARPLLSAYWDQATEVLVHPGVCSLAMPCSARQANFPGYHTVELVSDQPEAASVVIDSRNPEWVATCRLIVPDEDGAHGEPCADE
jgi:hypothetical protein